MFIYNIIKSKLFKQIQLRFQQIFKLRSIINKKSLAVIYNLFKKSIKIYKMDLITSVLAKHDLIKDCIIQRSNSVAIEKRFQRSITEQSQEKSYTITGSLTIPVELIKEANQELKSLPFQVSISRSINIGQVLPVYSGLHKVFQEEITELVHKKGEVLLVDVWATWCGPCQRPMQHNQEMLEKNQEKWKNKVRIVAVSVDDDKEIIKTKVQTKKWDKIEHLTLLGWNNDHPLIQNFEISGIPFVFLVDKQGKINFFGHPSSVKLQQRINQLIERQEKEGLISTQLQNLKINEFSSQNLIKCEKQVDHIHDIVTKQLIWTNFKNSQLFVVHANTSIRLKHGNLQKSTTKLTVSVYEDQQSLIGDFKQLIKSCNPAHYQIVQNLVKYQTAPISQNLECTDCKLNLSLPYYWCKWDANPSTFRCRNCVEKKPEDQTQYYSYLQNSILLTDKWNKIAQKGFGKNLQPKNLTEVQYPNGFSCNGCHQCPSQIGQARYICLACRSDPNPGDYVDICQKCLQKHLKGDEQIKQEFKKDQHTTNHPLLRILFNIQGYYQF